MFLVVVISLIICDVVFADSGHSGCGGPGFLNRHTGEITSHNHFNNHNHYHRNSNCHWRIRANAGHVVRLSSIHFDVEPDANCDYDYLNIYDGSSNSAKLIGKFCGGSDVEVVSSSRYLYLEFHSDDSNEFTGFKFKYSFQQASAGCGNSFFMCKNHRCIQKSFLCDQEDDCGDNSDESATCKVAPSNCAENEYTCVADQKCILKTWLCDGEPDCAGGDDEAGCGLQTGISGCGSSSMQNGTSGVISSMNFPIEYNNDSKCHWDINVPPGKYIKLEFNRTFEVEPGEGPVCEYDRVTVYSGSGGRHFVGEYCGYQAPDSVIIPGSHGIVRFSSDEGESLAGFQIKWTAVDGDPTYVNPTVDPGPFGCDKDIYYNGAGTIQTPGFDPSGHYKDNTTCVWRIFGPEGYNIKLHFNDFGTEMSHQCKYDSLKIYDGPSASDELIATICGNRLPHEEWSKTNNMMVVFTSDKVYHDIGFRAVFTAVKPNDHQVTDIAACTGTPTVLTATSGTILSDLYDGVTEYPNNLNCQWKINAPVGKVITLWFNAFEAESTENCNYDYLSVYDGKNSYGLLMDKLCGMVYPEKMTSETNHMYIQFISDETAGGFGFNLTYTIEDPLPSCQDSEFRCRDTHCIAYSKVCNGHDDCGDGSDELVCGNDGVCGRPAIKPIESNTRIVGGREAIPNSWPWQISMKHYGRHNCGGSIIHPQWVVTASHCVEDNRNLDHLTIEAGKHHEKKDDPHQQIRRVTKILMHESYDSDLIDNDITLFKLDKPFILNEYVNIVCLPEVVVADGANCMVTGWGDTKNTSGAGLLKQALLPIVNVDKCNSTDYLDGDATDNMLCAGYDQGGIDSCQGDSGGPFVCKSGTKWDLQGIVSWGNGCAEEKSPGAYTKVINYIQWIQEMVASHP